VKSGEGSGAEQRRAASHTTPLSLYFPSSPGLASVADSQPHNPRDPYPLQHLTSPQFEAAAARPQVQASSDPIATSLAPELPLSPSTTRSLQCWYHHRTNGTKPNQNQRVSEMTNQRRTPQKSSPLTERDEDHRQQPKRPTLPNLPLLILPQADSRRDLPRTRAQQDPKPHKLKIRKGLLR
jgi:hypothetical protein